MKLARVLLCAALFAAGAARADDLLTVDDVQKVSGLRGLQLVAKNPALGAGGELNFAGPDNRLVLMVMIQPLTQFTVWRQQHGTNALPLPELGVQAFRARPGQDPAYIAFVRAAKGIWIQSMGRGPGGQPRFTASQLLSLARIAAPRVR